MIGPETVRLLKPVALPKLAQTVMHVNKPGPVKWPRIEPWSVQIATISIQLET
jgi:hypothetical protein